MPTEDAGVIYHFVVRYWREPRELGSTAEVWRGKVSRVPTALEAESGMPEQWVPFTDLADLPAIVRSLIGQAGRPVPGGQEQGGRNHGG